MRPHDRIPTWQTNLKWFTGVLLVLSVAVFIIMFCLERVSTAPRALPLIETVLSVTLTPGGSLAASVSVEESPDVWQPGTPLQLLAGVEVYADPTEVAAFSVPQARERIAGVLTGELLTSGREAAMALVSGPVLADRLETALDGPVRQMIASQLAALMLDAGIGDGSRLADWQTQLQQQPGQPVQPIVGLLVRVDAELVGQQDALGIGMLVLDALAAELIERGVAGARELLANNTLLERFDAATAGTLGSSLHGLFSTLLLGSEAGMRANLEAAAAAMAGSAQGGNGAGERVGLPGASELAGLSAAEAESVILGRLAQVVHVQGPVGLRGMLTDAAQLERLEGVSGLLARLDSEAHGVWRARAWLWGAISVFLALALAALSSGWGRLFNPGIGILLAAGPALLLTLALRDVQARLHGMIRPAAFELEGGLVHAWRSQEHALSLIPAGSLDLLVRDASILAGLGALLVVLSMLGLLVQAVRPRRGRL